MTGDHSWHRERSRLGSVVAAFVLLATAALAAPPSSRRPNDHHPDHRYTGALVMDAADMVQALAGRLPAALTPDQDEEKAGRWVSLFNGHDLGGWTRHGQERWVVDKGEILGEAVTNAYGYLATVKTYRDFELKAKFKAEGTGNSGIFYHSKLDGVDIKGVQVEVDPHPGRHTGGLYESGGRGWLVKPAEAAEKALEVGGWNEIRALVRGPHVQSWVNGVPAVDYVDPSPNYTDGVIALQLHAGGEGRMRFKDIFVRRIE